MKKIILVAFFAIVATFTYAQGIQFFEGTFEEAKAKAKKENKKIFVDVYTTWCGPCKQMSKSVFPTKIVGDYFNTNFVSMKLDAENQSKHDFFNDFKASAFPTYFWVDADGVLLDMKSGSSTPEAFVEMAKEASKKTLGNNMKNLKKRWDNGERNAKIVQEYVLGTLPTFDANAIYPTMIDYLSGLSADELKSAENYHLFKSFCGPRDGKYKDDIISKTFFTNLKVYEKYENKYSVENPALHMMLYRTFVRTRTATYLSEETPKTESDKKIAEGIQYIKNLNFEYKDIFIECIKVEQLLYTKNYEKGIDMIEKVVEKYGEQMPTLRSNFLYSIVMSGYCKLEKKPVIDKVVKLATDNLKIIPGQTSIAYYGAIQYAAGNFQEAYSAMAWEGFYTGKRVSNATFSDMNILNIRQKFPVSTPEMEAETARFKAELRK